MRSMEEKSREEEMGTHKRCVSAIVVAGTWCRRKAGFEPEQPLQTVNTYFKDMYKTSLERTVQLTLLYPTSVWGIQHHHKDRNFLPTQNIFPGVLTQIRYQLQRELQIIPDQIEIQTSAYELNGLNGGISISYCIYSCVNWPLSRWIFTQDK